MLFILLRPGVQLLEYRDKSWDVINECIDGIGREILSGPQATFEARDKVQSCAFGSLSIASRVADLDTLIWSPTVIPLYVLEGQRIWLVVLHVVLVINLLET